MPRRKGKGKGREIIRKEKEKRNKRKIGLNANTLRSFFSLLHYTKNGNFKSITSRV